MEEMLQQVACARMTDRKSDMTVLQAQTHVKK